MPTLDEAESPPNDPLRRRPLLADQGTEPLIRWVAELLGTQRARNPVAYRFDVAVLRLHVCGSTNGCADNISGTPEVPQLADPLLCNRASRQVWTNC